MIKNHIDKILQAHNKQLGSLLNICESEIEKLFLIKVLSYMANRPFEFSFSFICEPLETIEVNGMEYMKTNKGHYSDAYWGVNITGIKIHKKIDDTIFYLYPQKELHPELLSSGKKYRLDFSIEKYGLNDLNKVLKLYCVECDGHDFHSTKQQIRSDNTRLRDILLLNNYITLRYSGSELFNWDEEGVGLFLFNL